MASGYVRNMVLGIVGNSRNSVVAIAFWAVLLVFAAIGCGSADSSTGAAQVEALSIRVSALEERTEYLANQLVGRELKKWKGLGRKRTEPFTIEEGPWAITWTLKRGLFSTFLTVDVFNADNETPTELAAIDTRLEGTDVTFVYELGTFYLEIDGKPDWSVRVSTPN